MNYQIGFKPRALKDLKRLPPNQKDHVLEKVEALQTDLTGDVKRLTNFTPEYRLRVGDYRVLFEIEGRTVVVYPRVASERCLQMKATNAMTLHPEILKKNGKNEFVVLPYKEFLAVQERLADAEDLLELRKAKRTEGNQPVIPLAKVKRILAEDHAPVLVCEKPAKYGK